MDHDLLHDHLIMPSSAFFNLCAQFPYGGGRRFAASAVLNECGGWAGDLMQLGGGVVNTVRTVADDHHQLWQSAGGGYLDDPRQPAGLSLETDGVDGSTAGNNRPWNDEKHGVPDQLTSSEPHRADGNVLGTTTRKRRDRAKTIVLERTRRVRLQEKLYQLRALVPNITKMDKASIIADAVVYVQNLQSRARKLKEEVAALDDEDERPSFPGPPRHDDDRRAEATADKHRQQDDDDDSSRGSSTTHGARVARVGATRVGEGRFLVTVECEWRDGVAARLCAAVESLACFRVESSSLGRSAPDRVVSTATLKTTCPVEAATIGEGTVKLLMLAALGEEGFGIDATAGIS